MRKQEVDMNTDVDAGLCGCAYGGIGFGKTLQLLTLLGVSDDLLIISNEPKDIKRTIKQGLKLLGYEDRKVYVWEFDSFAEYRKEIGDLKLQYEGGNKPYGAIGFDTLSFVQSKFKRDFEDSRYEMGIVDNKRKEGMMHDMFRIEMADWGGMASAMCRITWMLNEISKYGVYVICNAGITEYPSWDKSMEAAPNFQGKEYASVMAGYFDLVGLVIKNEDTETGYPPKIRFTSEDDSFVCRNCHERLANKAAVLDWGKIIKAIST